MAKYFESGNSGNPWILKAFMAAMGMPTSTSQGIGQALSGTQVGQSYQAMNNPMTLNPVGNLSSPVPTLQTDIANNMLNQTNKGNFIGNLGKSLWQQSPIGQMSSSAGNILNGNFNQAMPNNAGIIDPNQSLLLSTILQKYRR